MYHVVRYGIDRDGMRHRSTKTADNFETACRVAGFITIATGASVVVVRDCLKCGREFLVSSALDEICKICNGPPCATQRLLQARHPAGHVIVAESDD